MSEAKFTKGGWNFNQEIEVDDSMVIVDDNHNVIAYLHSGCVFDGSGYFNKMNDEQEANANLIAAAPEMYEMLELARNEIYQLIYEVNDQRASKITSTTETEPDYHDQETVYLIDKLLAKARGEL